MLQSTETNVVGNTGTQVILPIGEPVGREQVLVDVRTQNGDAFPFFVSAVNTGVPNDTIPLKAYVGIGNASYVIDDMSFSRALSFTIHASQLRLTARVGSPTAGYGAITTLMRIIGSIAKAGYAVPLVYMIGGAWTNIAAGANVNVTLPPFCKYFTVVVHGVAPVQIKDLTGEVVYVLNINECRVRLQASTFTISVGVIDIKNIGLTPIMVDVIPEIEI